MIKLFDCLKILYQFTIPTRMIVIIFYHSPQDDCHNILSLFPPGWVVCLRCCFCLLLRPPSSVLRFCSLCTHVVHINQVICASMYLIPIVLLLFINSICNSVFNEAKKINSNLFRNYCMYQYGQRFSRFNFI